MTQSRGHCGRVQSAPRGLLDPLPGLIHTGAPVRNASAWLGRSINRSNQHAQPNPSANSRLFLMISVLSRTHLNFWIGCRVHHGLLAGATPTTH